MNYSNLITPAWFRLRKPYKDQLQYDLEYLKICKDVFKIIFTAVQETRSTVYVNDVGELAYILTSYFEDRVNQIGFWEAVITEHQRLYGQRVPFYTSTDLQQWADCEDIHPADIHYLSFVYFAFLYRTGQTKSMPDERFFLIIRDRVFDYLDGIEEVASTDFYRNYLIQDGTHTDFKRILTWFAYNSYLFSYEFKYKEKKVEKHIRAAENGLDRETFILNFHMQLEQKMYEDNTGLSALSPVEVLSTALNWPGHKLQDTRNTRFSVKGYFELDEDQDCLYLTHTITNERFTLKKSELPPIKNKFTGRYFHAGLHRWGDSYTLGEAIKMAGDEATVDFFNRENYHEFCLHSQEYRQKLKDELNREYQLAKDVYGEKLKIFADKAEWVVACAKLEQRRFDRDVSEGLLDPTIHKPFPIRADHIGDGVDIGVVATPDDVVFYMPNYIAGMNFLKKNPSINEVLEYFRPSAGLSLVALLHVWDSANPAPTNVPWAINNRKDFEALLRIIKPFGFNEHAIPKMKVKL